MRKKTLDMTRGSIMKPLVLFILPLIGSSIFQQLYNTVDFLFVGNFMDRTAAAAVGATSTLISCMVGLFTGMSVGTGVVMSQYIGGGNRDKANRTMHTAVAFGIVAGLIIMALGILFAPAILRLLNTPENVIPEGVLYIRIYLISLPMLIFYNMLSGAMYANGDSATPFRILAFCGFVNVGADFLFIRVIPLGVAGVSIATAVSQFLSAVLVAYFAMRRLGFSFKKLQMDFSLLKRILRIGLPAGLQAILLTFSNIMVQYYINDFGETAVAAFATYYKLENFVYLPIMAFGQAATTFAGQNYGAGQYKRIKKGAVMTSLLGSVIVFCIAGLMLLFARPVFTIFMKDYDVVTNAIMIASVSFPFYWIYPIMEVTGGMLRGMGYAVSSMAIIISNMCVFRILLLYIFSRVYHTIPSLAAVYPITWAMATVCFITVFILVMRKLSKPT